MGDVPPPPLEQIAEQPPEPPKKRPVLQLGLSKKSVEAIAKSNEKKTSEPDGTVNGKTAKPSDSTGKKRSKARSQSPKQAAEFDQMSELEIVSIATGRSVKELKKLSKEELRA